MAQLRAQLERKAFPMLHLTNEPTLAQLENAKVQGMTGQELLPHVRRALGAAVARGDKDVFDALLPLAVGFCGLNMKTVIKPLRNALSYDRRKPPKPAPKPAKEIPSAATQPPVLPAAPAAAAPPVTAAAGPTADADAAPARKRQRRNEHAPPTGARGDKRPAAAVPLSDVPAGAANPPQAAAAAATRAVAPAAGAAGADPATALAAASGGSRSRTRSRAARG